MIDSNDLIRIKSSIDRKSYRMLFRATTTRRQFPARSVAMTAGAAAFVEWLKGAEAQGTFRRFGYDPPGDASSLRA
jgi:hypothetical protein